MDCKFSCKWPRGGGEGGETKGVWSPVSRGQYSLHRQCLVFTVHYGCLKVFTLRNVELGRPLRVHRLHKGTITAWKQVVFVCMWVRMCVCQRKKERLSLEGVLQTVCVCLYGCALCGVTGVKKKKIEMWRKKWETWKNNKKSCYSVWPARALRINLAGVTVSDLNWRHIGDPYFFQSGSSLDPGKDCAHIFSFIQRQTACVLVLERSKKTCHPPEDKSVFQMYLILSLSSAEQWKISE